MKDSDYSVIYGCVYKIKRLKKLSFVYLRRKSQIIETVYRPESCIKDISLLSEGMYLSAKIFKLPQKRSNNGTDLMLADFEILSYAHEAPPIPINSADFSPADDEYSENIAAAVRHPKTAEIIRLKSVIQKAFSDTMHSLSFINVNTPSLVPYSEKASFEVDYFGEQMYLPYSPQIYLTPYTASLDRVFEISHSFLAKKFNSPRHLNEFVTMSFQIGYIESLDDIMDITALIIGSIRTALFQTCCEYFKFPDTNSVPIPRIRFCEALKILQKPTQCDLDPTDIKKLCRIAKKEYGSDYVFVTDFIPGKRQFYIAQNPDGSLKCFDLLGGGMKLGTGSVNISDYENLLSVMPESKSLKAYSDALKYGIMPYGGVCLGLERCTAQMLGLPSVKRAGQIVRDIHNCLP